MTDDLALLIAASESAAAIATGFFRADPKTWMKADQSPVTEADLAVDTHLCERLQAARPGYGWMSEETPDDPARRQAETVFIVDPIDGTRAFAAGEKGWAHALAVVHRGAVTAAVVHLPARGKMYTAALGQGAHLNGVRLSVSDRAEPEGATVLASRTVAEPQHWQPPAPAFKRQFRPALAYRLALVAEGRYDALLTLRPAWEWDIAAGALLVTEAGGQAGPAGGAPHQFNSAARQAPNFLAANPALYAALSGRLA